jgi:hypothetical protein
MAQVVGHLSSMHKALFNPRNGQKKKKKRVNRNLGSVCDQKKKGKRKKKCDSSLSENDSAMQTSGQSSSSMVEKYHYKVWISNDFKTTKTSAFLPNLSYDDFTYLKNTYTKGPPPFPVSLGRERDKLYEQRITDVAVARESHPSAQVTSRSRPEHRPCTSVNFAGLTVGSEDLESEAGGLRPGERQIENFSAVQEDPTAGWLADGPAPPCPRPAPLPSRSAQAADRDTPAPSPPCPAHLSLRISDSPALRPRLSPADGPTPRSVMPRPQRAAVFG